MTALEKRDELADDAVNKMARLMKEWKNRITLDNLRLSERYLKGEIELLIQFRSVLPDNTGNLCAVLKYWKPFARRDGDGIFNLREQTGGLLNLREQIFEERMLGSKAKAKLPHAICDDEQEAVFVDIVKVVELPEVVIPTLVWLDGIDETYDVRAHSLYFSRRFGFVFGRSFTDGKAGGFSGTLPIGLNQLPGQMVEAAPQLVDGLTGNQGKFSRRLGANLNPKNSLSGLRICLAEESIWVGFAKGLQPTFKITDVMFGPFDFKPDSCLPG
jgi:hypothetical protein